MGSGKARDELVVAALRLAAAEKGGLDGRDVLNERSRAADRLDLAARLYIEEIGPRVAEAPERPYGSHEVRDSHEEEE